MPVNLGLDTAIADVTKLHSSGFRKRVEDFIERAFKSDRNDFGSAATLTAAEQSGLATGQLLDFAGTVVPAGFLECNGAEVSRSTYADLWSAIGTTYGTAQAATDFKLPDFSGASATGAGGTRVAGPGVAVGSTHLTDTVTLVAGNMPQHAHSIDEQSGDGGGHAHNWTRYPPFGFEVKSSQDGSGNAEEGASGQNDQQQLIDTINSIQRSQNHFVNQDRSSWIAHSLANLGRDALSRGNIDEIAPYALGTPGISYSEPSADATSGLAGSHTHSVTGDIDDAGSGAAMNVLQPSLAVMVLIKT